MFLYRSNADEGRITSGETENDANNLQNELDKCYKTRFPHYQVKLVYITLSKRSNTRLMTHKGACDGESEIRPNQMANPPPGTVVDRRIVSMNK